MKKRLRNHGVEIGTLPTGPGNRITDVAGVLVGHATCDESPHQTGVTVVIPGVRNPFTEKYTAAVYVINGFGKSQGLVQIEELGALETPIALTNTLNVGRVHDALVTYMLQRCDQDGISPVSINPVVCECNDSRLNRIQDRVVSEAHVQKAIETASIDFDEGSVGAGRGTTAFGLKGGIGSASRVIRFDEKPYTLGVLVQSNHGCREDLMINGQKIPLLSSEKATAEVDQGSIIIIVATDLPVSDRQLKRIIKRVGVGLARTGSYLGHGSGEIAVGFSTANPVHHHSSSDFMQVTMINENQIDRVFRAVVEATEEAVLNSMITATPVAAGKEKPLCLSEVLGELNWPDS
ncbi:P1 family peptidase [Anoxynatronum sibiricum]|uniref:P1 family peptidase n=1 Tax=Anoxynatronum sibiricum TaxID=210623 RepID=A0ABU9VQU7_9CLOT